MHSGNTHEALQNISDMMKLAKSDKFKHQDLLTSEMYQQEGKNYAEIGRYDKAVESLNLAIAKDPKNYQAHFERATAYFELGEFDKSLDDYIFSKKSDYFTPYKLPPNEFVDAFCQAAFSGASDSACDFVPSLCNTAYGLGECLWVFGERPLDSITNLASAGYEMLEIIVDHLKTIDRDALHEYASELVKLYENFNSLTDHEKGELVGYVVGKYGVDIFAGSAAIKSVSAYKKLKAANQICNLESMAISTSSKEAIIVKGIKNYTERSNFFEKCKIHWDKQNKHVPGKHNYQEGKSIFEHGDAEGLLKKHAGTGMLKRGEVGKPGYQEIVDFNENIGFWRNKTESLPTTKGTIHYSKDGAHIVPENPNAMMR
jgi:tetratricopeptide (TPR) repeat protein